MKKSNLELVQEMYGHFSTGSIPSVFEMLTDDVEYFIPGSPDIPYAGTFVGKKEVGGFYKRLNDTLQYTSFDIKSFTTDGDKGTCGGCVWRNRKTNKQELSSRLDNDMDVCQWPCEKASNLFR